MPKILINEVDYTKAGTNDYSNYAVLVPGLHYKKLDSEGNPLNYFDENGVFECTSQADFVEKMGKVPAKAINDTVIVLLEGEDEPLGEEINIPAHYGNQIAYELLGMGIKVLYLNLGEVPEEFATSDGALEDKDLLYLKERFDLFSQAGFWDPLQDKANYDFRFIIHGLMTGSMLAAVNQRISELAAFVATSAEHDGTGRGDCLALIELNKEAYYASRNNPSELISAIETEVNGLQLAGSGKFAAITVPSICYQSSAMKNDSDYLGNNEFPASFHYLACFATMLANNYPEWYAVAGMTRGVSSLAVESTSVKLGETAVNALEPRTKESLTRACNVIANFRNQYYLWGNRTAHLLEEELRASHFLNIRNLCTTIKKQLYVSCRRFTFDPNSDVLWVNFVESIKPTLERMKADQGIRDYKIVKVATNKKATLKAKVRIIPIEAVEDFELEISLEDSFGDVNLNVTE